MTRQPNTHGGGAETNRHGLHFEQVTSLNEALIELGFSIAPNGEVFRNGIMVAMSAPKSQLYSRILLPRGVEWEEHISRKLLPDEALLNLTNNTVYIIEKKFQNADGSVDEKLQTCDFKFKQYKKLFSPIGIEVKYVFVVNDFFNNPKYIDVIRYINETGSYIFFNEIPIDFLGITSDF